MNKKPPNAVILIKETITTITAALSPLAITDGCLFPEVANKLDAFKESPLMLAQADNLAHSVEYAELVVNNNLWCAFNPLNAVLAVE